MPAGYPVSVSASELHAKGHSPMPIVVIANTNQGLKMALEEVFAPFGGVEAVIPKNGGTVYIKPNGIHFTPYTYSDPRVLEAVLSSAIAAIAAWL